MVIEMQPSYIVSFQINPAAGWHRYPCKLSAEGKDNLIAKLTEKGIPTRVEEVKNEMVLLVA